MGKHIIYSKKTQKLPHISFFWPQIVCLTKYALLKLVCKKSKSLSRTNLRKTLSQTSLDRQDQSGVQFVFCLAPLCVPLLQKPTQVSQFKQLLTNIPFGWRGVGLFLLWSYSTLTPSSHLFDHKLLSAPKYSGGKCEAICPAKDRPEPSHQKKEVILNLLTKSAKQGLCIKRICCCKESLCSVNRNWR